MFYKINDHIIDDITCINDTCINTLKIQGTVIKMFIHIHNTDGN